jgi:hypothetical protein
MAQILNTHAPGKARNTSGALTSRLINLTHQVAQLGHQTIAMPGLDQAPAPHPAPPAALPYPSHQSHAAPDRQGRKHRRRTDPSARFDY